MTLHYRCLFSLSFAADTGDGPGTPIITITEDHSVPLDDDDFVKYFGLESHTEQGSRPTPLLSVCPT